jgi:phosphoribosylamine--glycine ligase
VPLFDGIVDTFQSHGLTIVGPTKAAARLEGCKVFSAEVLKDAKVPAPEYEVFEQSDRAGLKARIRKKDGPWVLKYAGLAGGKGVLVTSNHPEAGAFIDKYSLKGKIVLQEHLEGAECSFQVLTDGHYALPLMASRDYKRAFNNDQGPNTGGMGSYAPYPLNKGLERTIMNTIVYPTIHRMRRLGHTYKGVMYFGLMLTKDGPKVLEINVRLGDPECQSILALLLSSLHRLLWATTRKGELEKLSSHWNNKHAVTVTLAAEGYPTNPKTGEIIEGLERNSEHGSWLLPAGVSEDQSGNLQTSGGRVAYAVGTGETILGAQCAAYKAAQLVKFPGKLLRTDIGYTF